MHGSRTHQRQLTLPLTDFEDRGGHRATSTPTLSANSSPKPPRSHAPNPITHPTGAFIGHTTVAYDGHVRRPRSTRARRPHPTGTRTDHVYRTRTTATFAKQRYPSPPHPPQNVPAGAGLRAGPPHITPNPQPRPNRSVPSPQPNHASDGHVRRTFVGRIRHARTSFAYVVRVRRPRSSPASDRNTHRSRLPDTHDGNVRRTTISDSSEHVGGETGRYTNGPARRPAPAGSWGRMGVVIPDDAGSSNYPGIVISRDNGPTARQRRSHDNVRPNRPVRPGTRINHV